MAKKKNARRSINKTLLLVGEGYAEKAFLSHLKSLFSNGKFKVSIVTAGGKGPEHVINHAISCKKCDGYDFVIVLLDTDLVWPKTYVQRAMKAGINLIGSEPCLEGLLLDILGKKRPESNGGCKEILHPLLNGSCTDRDSYSELFTSEILDNCQNVKIKFIIEALQGKENKSAKL
ncbi:RloB domain-containing protein [Dickeya fangzhongdai]|uniref:RloB domain-containing protein n=1 Tax=Dickeya fangzhongdai TaxID=1778540 RepID=UPI0008FFAC21|nr:RloB domain-containing protein [Dickeya fangzhongdai]